MTTRYTEELAGWVSRRAAPRPRQDRNIVAFLAVKEDVRAALEAGYAMKTIWAHLTATGRLAGRYETFTQHVKRYLRTAPAAAGSPSPPAPPASTPPPAPGEPRKTPPPSVGGFTFNATPKTEDLF